MSVTAVPDFLKANDDVGNVSTAPDCSWPGEHGFGCLCAHITEPHQHTIIEDHMQSWRPMIEGATDAEIERLVRVIDSIKLTRAIQRRTQLDQLIHKAGGELAELRKEWNHVAQGIQMMIARGVE